MKSSSNHDFDHATRPMKILSWPVGTWPLQEYNIFSTVRFFLAMCILILSLVLVTTEICLDSGDPGKTMDSLVFNACGILAILKIFQFRYHRHALVENITSAVRDYEETIDEEKKTIIRRHAYMARVACVTVISFSNFSATFFMIVAIMVGDETPANATDDVLAFPIPSEYTLALIKMPENYFIVVFVAEYLFAIVIGIGSDSLFFGLIFHLCGQVAILNCEFRKHVKPKERAAQHFNALVTKHQYLLRLSNMLIDTISFVMIVQLFISCLLICTGGEQFSFPFVLQDIFPQNFMSIFYQAVSHGTTVYNEHILHKLSGVDNILFLISTHGICLYTFAERFQFLVALQVKNLVICIKTIVVMLTLLSQIFAYSYVGDYLKRQLEEIGDSAYQSNWYDLPAHSSRKVIFVVERAQDPVQITAGKFFVVNMETFMSIVKTSISYLSVLRVMIKP